MPAKEIKELRQAGKLEEAYNMARTELQANTESIWAKRNMSWVLYSQLSDLASNTALFLAKIDEVRALNLPESEDMFFENICIVISKAARAISSENEIDKKRLFDLFDAIKLLPLKKPSKWYSVLYSAFHKGMKELPKYIEFADWWKFENFMPEDYQKGKMSNGKDIMALAEQAYIAYARHLLPKHGNFENSLFDIGKISAFMPSLDKILEEHPDYQYPPYYKAKLLLALGDKENMLSALLPFAKKKRNDFWVWDVLSEVFSEDGEKVLACYCRALSCSSPEEMLVRLRQRMADIFIHKQLFDEAKTEIEYLIKARNENEWRIPTEVINWQSQEWYKSSVVKSSNFDFYEKYFETADELLFSKEKEEMVFVDFVNKDRKILNFICSEQKAGFFKYDRFLGNVQIGDVLKVRFQSGSKEGLFKIFTAKKHNDEKFRGQFFKNIEGNLKIPEGKNFGFVNDIYVHPDIVKKDKFENGMKVSGKALKSFNRDKKQWNWRFINS